MPSSAHPHRGPQFLVALWRDGTGRWRGRVKSLQDGRERPVEGLESLPALLDDDTQAAAPEEADQDA